jgi:hypothetical protein
MTSAMASNYYEIDSPPARTYVRWGVDRWESQQNSWVDLPDADIPLQVGS